MRRVAALQTVGSADKCSAEVGGESGPRDLSTALKASHVEPGGERLERRKPGSTAQKIAERRVQPRTPRRRRLLGAELRSVD